MLPRRLQGVQLCPKPVRFVMAVMAAKPSGRSGTWVSGRRRNAISRDVEGDWPFARSLDPLQGKTRREM
jgi:hypothetical protein